MEMLQKKSDWNDAISEKSSVQSSQSSVKQKKTLIPGSAALRQSPSKTEEEYASETSDSEYWAIKLIFQTNYFHYSVWSSLVKWSASLNSILASFLFLMRFAS